MQLSQKISVSLDISLLSFIDRYAQDHASKGRSAVVAKALQMLQLTEQENDLAEAYSQSASQDKNMAAEFEASLADGLVSVQHPSRIQGESEHAAW